MAKIIDIPTDYLVITLSVDEVVEISSIPRHEAGIIVCEFAARHEVPVSRVSVNTLKVA